MKLLFFGRKSENFSIKLHKFLKKKGLVKVIWSDGKSNKINFKILGTFDYIICFRSNYILTKELIKKANKAAINFHPGIPKYRGIGCANLALLNNTKTYGSTAHLINEKIDNGNILDVSSFKIKPSDNINTMLSKTHKIMFKQSISILKKIFNNHKNIEKLIIKNKKNKWSKQLMTRKKLNKMYEISLPINEKILMSKIRALQTDTFKIFVKVKKNKFYIN